ncbi:hypothetical protein BH10PSE16_BH10PSE16_03910 [soil metagenome]
MQAGDQPSSGADRQSDPRAMARERAMAESQAIARRQSQERLKRELQTIAVIRKERIANSKAGLRRRLMAVAAATGLVCVAVGYAVGTKSPAPVQLHIIERIEPAPASEPPAGAAVAAHLAQPSPPTAPAPSQEAAPVQAAPPAALAVPLPLPARMLAPAPPAQRAPPPRISNAPLPERTADKPAAKPPEEGEFVLSRSRAKAAPEARATDPAQALPAALDFKVVNVIEGTVIVRQGRSVRQIKVGEKMPDGQTLKSVSVDKGQFETSP